MKAITIKVGGMSCQHCAKAVEKALINTPGVTSAKVDLAKAAAEVNVDETIFDIKSAKAAINEEGYEFLGEG